MGRGEPATRPRKKEIIAILILHYTVTADGRKLEPVAARFVQGITGAKSEPVRVDKPKRCSSAGRRGNGDGRRVGSVGFGTKWDRPEAGPQIASGVCYDFWSRLPTVDRGQAFGTHRVAVEFPVCRYPEPWDFSRIEKGSVERQSCRSSRGSRLRPKLSEAKCVVEGCDQTPGRHVFLWWQ